MTKEKPPFKKGDKVTTTYLLDEKDIVRKVISCTQQLWDKNLFLMNVDEGELCPHCGRRGRRIRQIGAAWFKKVEEKNNGKN